MFRRFIFYFFLLILFISIYFAYTSVTFTTKVLDSIAAQEATRLVAMALEEGNVLDERVLNRLRKLLGGEVFVYSKSGALLASTYKGSLPEDLKQLTPEDLEALKQGPVVKKVSLGGQIYRQVLFEARISKEISCYFGLLLPTTFEQRVKRELTVGLVYTAFCGLVFMVVVSWFLSRSVTKPLEELAAVVRKMGGGSFPGKVPVKGPPEVRALAQAFNEMTERLQEYQQRLIESERMATAAQLAASMAHEIKNPLTSLRLAAELLCTLLADQPELAKRAEVILREATRLENIVQNMLKRTRRLDLHLQETDLNKLAQEVVESASYQIKARGQMVSLELAENPVVAWADPEKIKQVIWNLLNNASEVTPKGGLIKIRTEEVDDDRVAVIIEDSGPGVPEDRLKELFKPFYTTKPEGTGLGLAISRQIILLHGGELILENREEGGARAKVILPRPRPQERSED